MKAVIMAGGKGAHLKPYTTSIPKPLVPMDYKAIIETRQPIALFPNDDYWLDIGRPEDYEKANKDIRKIEGLS